MQERQATSRDSIAQRADVSQKQLWRVVAAATMLSTACTGTPSTQHPDAGTPHDANGSDALSPPICGGGTRQVFTFEFLEIPELASAPGDAFDIDHTGDVCSVPDWPNRLDNHLPDNLRDFETELPGVDIRDAIDGLVVCDETDQCGSAVRIEREAGVDCDRYSVLTDTDTVVASGTGVGESGLLGALSLGLLVDGQLVRIRLSGTTFRLAGDQSRLLLGGYLNASDNRTFATNLCAIATSSEGQCDVDGFVDLWSSQGDIQTAGLCDALSVALTLSRVTAP